MGSYGVIKEALLVKKNGAADEYSVVHKLVPTAVNGIVWKVDENGGFEFDGQAVSAYSVCNGGVFGFSEDSKIGSVYVDINIPGYGHKQFQGDSNIQNVKGLGQGVMCPQKFSDHSTPYTHLFLVVESPGSVFAEQV